MEERQARQLAFLQALVAQRATIAGDVVEVANDTWAIHGSIPVDGEVLLAEYVTRRDAKDALAHLSSSTTLGSDERQG